MVRDSAREEAYGPVGLEEPGTLLNNACQQCGELCGNKVAELLVLGEHVVELEEQTNPC